MCRQFSAILWATGLAFVLAGSCFQPVQGQLPTRFLVFGDSSPAALGWSVSGAGDVNGDGFADFIAGAPFVVASASTPPGRAFVYSGVDGSVLHTLVGVTNGDWFGYSVSGAGDVNGDGFDDVIVGSPLADTLGIGQGLARVYSGLDGSVLFNFEENFSGTFGASVSAAGDVNGDGFDDVIVGNDSSPTGRAVVYSGSNGGVLHSLSGFSKFGSSVSGVGDIDGDGVDDLLIGSPNQTRVFVHSGLSGALIRSISDPSVYQFGTSVSGAGDVDGDGLADIVVGAPRDSSLAPAGGRISVHSGQDGTLFYALAAGTSFGRLGNSVSGIGDVNGDGLPDLIAGMPGENAGGPGFSGGFRVLSLCGARSYGVGIEPEQTLSCEWKSDGCLTDLPRGDILVNGAAPFSSGVLALSAQSAMDSMLGLTVLVDLSLSASFITSFSYDGAGQYSAEVDLRHAPLAGVTFFLQVGEANASAPMGFYSSNGVELIFCR